MSVLVIDSSFASLKEAIQNPKVPIPKQVRRTLVLVTVYYYSFDGLVHQGQLVVHRALKREIEEIFRKLLTLRFPIKKVVPISLYDWDDDASMADNNSSAFNYRLILGTDRLSNHSFGLAVDLNPLQNPYFARDGKVYPQGAVHDPSVPGTIARDGPVVSLFKARGWTWGGDWTIPVDYQHFEKPATAA